MQKTLQDWVRFSPWLFAIAFIYWFSSFSTFGISVDQEYALIREDQTVWLSQGRWAIFFITQYLYPQPVVMYFPQLIFITCMVISYLFIVDSLKISTEKKWLVLLAFPIFAAHPVWYFIVEFPTNTIPTALGMLSTALSAWLFAQSLTDNKETPARYIAQLALLMFALGCYQSLIFVAATLYSIILLVNIGQSKTKIGVAAALIITSLILNHFLLKILFFLFNTHPSYIAENIHLNAWLSKPIKSIESYFKTFFRFYSGSVKTYQSNLFTMGLIILCALYGLIKNHKKTTLFWLLLIAILAIPITPQILGAGQSRIPYRTFLAVSITCWVACWYVLSTANTKKSVWIAIILTLLLNVQILYTHARYSSSKQLVFQYDRHTALALNQRILQLIPDYDYDKSYGFSVQGPLNYANPYGSLATTLLNGSLFAWDDGNRERISIYMSLLGYRGLVPVDEQTQQELQGIYAQMPTWPAKDAVQLHNNIILVKFQ